MTNDPVPNNIHNHDYVSNGRVSILRAFVEVLPSNQVHEHMRHFSIPIHVQPKHVLEMEQRALLLQVQQAALLHRNVEPRLFVQIRCTTREK